MFPSHTVFEVEKHGEITVFVPHPEHVEHTRFDVAVHAADSYVPEAQTAHANSCETNRKLGKCTRKTTK